MISADGLKKEREEKMRGRSEKIVTLGAGPGARNCEMRGEVPLYRSHSWRCGMARGRFDAIQFIDVYIKH